MLLAWLLEGDSKTTFVTVNQDKKWKEVLGYLKNSKTTFVTVNQDKKWKEVLGYLKNSKTTFVTVNQIKRACHLSNFLFKNNFCYC